jgi:tocopherol O-methyltransferase
LKLCNLEILTLPLPVQIREHYDSLALIYQTFWGDHIHHGLFIDPHDKPEAAQVRLLDHCAQRLNLRGRERILDVGCGHGGTLVHLARLLDCSGIGVTVSPKQARIARERAMHAGVGDRSTFFVDDVACFPFPPAEFDLVWAMESTEHFADKAKFLHDAYCTLQPAGQLLLAAWTGSMDRPRIREVARAFLCPELWTAEQYQATAQSTGMTITRRENLTENVVRTWEICQERVRTARTAVKLLPRAAREFINGIDIILDAYRSGDLSYTVLVARK